MAGLQAIAAVAEAIRDLREVPSGHLYAGLCGQLSLAEYDGIISVLKRADLVKEANHLLTWTGPVSAEAAPSNA